MARLGTWAKRFEITVDNTNIDSDLTHYPIPIVISDSCGQDNDDLTEIFDDLGANWQKIAVTKSNGTTQIYVEKEKWDDTAEEAVLWVSKSDLTVTSASTITLYIYFDPAQSDNSSYVAAVGSRTEVWDSNFKMVQHLSGANAAGCLDSTSNNNDVASDGGDPTYESSGKVGDCVYLDGNDQLVVSDANSLDITGNITVQVWGNLDAESGIQVFVDKTGSSSSNDQYGLWYDNRSSQSYPDRVSWLYDNAGDRWEGGITATNWNLIHGVYDGSDAIIYNNGAEKVSATEANSPAANARNLYIGSIGGSFYTEGYIDEVRISDTDRSAAWIKADFYAMTDNLLSYGAVEETFSDRGRLMTVFSGNF